MYPPPITIIFLGTFFKERAPVEDTILSSSKLIFGILEGSEPVAIIIFSPSISDSLLSEPLIFIFLSETKLPKPLK